MKQRPCKIFQLSVFLIVKCPLKFSLWAQRNTWYIDKSQPFSFVINRLSSHNTGELLVLNWSSQRFRKPTTAFSIDAGKAFNKLACKFYIYHNCFTYIITDPFYDFISYMPCLFNAFESVITTEKLESSRKGNSVKQEKGLPEAYCWFWDQIKEFPGGKSWW